MHLVERPLIVDGLLCGVLHRIQKRYPPHSTVLKDSIARQNVRLRWARGGSVDTDSVARKVVWEVCFVREVESGWALQRFNAEALR